jgi:arginyl-tRNA synthetase
MVDFKEIWRERVAGALNALLEEGGKGPLDPGVIGAEYPPKPEQGDLGFPMFAFAKLLRKGPQQIAEAVAARLGPEAFALGPYVNVRLNRGESAAALLPELLDESRPIGRPGTLDGSRIMVEFSSPNTNKPLHLGHLRNDVLGESISRILRAAGAEVRKVCIINDRGIHICKSMLAYKEGGGGKTPESEGIKSDHFVGAWYVAFHRMAAADPSAEERARELLRLWEAGDPETVELWKTMNKWTVDGMKATYVRTGVSFDQYYFESQTYLLGKKEVLKGLEGGIFYRADDGSIWVDLTRENLDKKVLLRKDGTSIYITQDIGTAIYRHEDWPFDRLVYVVGSEQQYHFQVLFAILKKLGFPWAENLCHLSYGMVNLPDGKMKSREGTVVDADELIDSLAALARSEIRDKDREAAVGDSAETAEKIALGALHYYLLSVSPSKDMLFKSRESLSFNGNTGPYLQYMGARISSMLQKAREQGVSLDGPFNAGVLTDDAEWELVKILGNYRGAVAQAAENLDSSILAAYLYELSRAFSRFYHDCPILNAPSKERSAARLALSRAVLRVLADAFDLVCIPFLKAM